MSFTKVFIPFIPEDIPFDVQLYETRNYLYHIVELYNNLLEYHQFEITKYAHELEKLNVETKKINGLRGEIGRMKVEQNNLKLENCSLTSETNELKIDNNLLKGRVENLTVENDTLRFDTNHFKEENERLKAEKSKLRTAQHELKIEFEKSLIEIKEENDKFKKQEQILNNELTSTKKILNQPFKTLTLEPNEILKYQAILIYEKRYSFKLDRIIFKDKIQLKKKKYQNYDLYSFSDQGYNLILDKPFEKKSHYLIVYWKNGSFYGTEFAFLTEFACVRMIEILKGSYSILSFFQKSFIDKIKEDSFKNSIRPN